VRTLMNESHIRNVIEAALLAAGKPLQPAELVELFDEGARPQVQDIQAALTTLMAEYSNRGIEIKETAVGFRIQVRREMANEISRLWPERPARYSRALLETLALIAYRQPITRAEIEAVRGVAVNPNILKTVIERNWVRVVGHRDVPGRPELLGTTRDFLDYFGLKNLDELPPLAELKVIGDIKVQFDLPDPGPVALAGDANEAAGAEDAARVEGAAAAGVVDALVEVAGAVGEGAEGAAAGSAGGQGAEGAAAGSAGGQGAEGAAADGAGGQGAGGAAADGAMAAGAFADGMIEDAVGQSVDDPQVASEGNDGPAGAAPPNAGGDGTSAEGLAVGSAGGEAVVSATADGTVEGAVGGGVHDQQLASEGSDGSAGAAPSHGGDGPAGAVATGNADEASTSKAAHRSAGDHKKSTVTRRGAPDSALHEAEEFAASIDADLAAGDDDGSDDDELSAAGPGSSELVAGPRDIDE
jgi:segregation and condensation protein B